MITVIIPTIKKMPSWFTDDLNLPVGQGIEVLVIEDKDKKGAPWARNQGLKEAQGEYVFFCDDDIRLEDDALWELQLALETNPEAGYAYGWYMRGNEQVGRVVWDADRLRQHNFISTMSLIRRDICVPWDESLKRLQDWDYYLTLLNENIHGIFIDKCIFTTPAHDGITFNGEITYEEAHKIVSKKHGQI